ncbi:tRNA lysidine(34) synthetase TilS [Halioglobus maricola]|uniref:tRNA(Ile)-lysidine synthase n=1 Tax=Halioglobus maricola TaxID=2601894 RepID=A0A5P9NIA6_9GAMM|nr:tRNA lysidine(34) synthetase TilS [Halioglobus maricola]QFU75522.1 tRNA lysidine(34) synthetase TilS [Halioglobus maricola]
MSRALDHSALDATLGEFLDAPHWYVAFSGGSDSTALLHLIREWRRTRDTAPPLTALHVNHGLQQGAGEWQNHCAWICRFLDVHFEALEADVDPDGKGLEAAAREARYALLEATLEPGAVVFFGHHQDDQVETLFLRLLRGAGVDGLAAMPARRKLGRGELSRPLLDVPRSALDQYTERHGLSCIEDPSNSDISLDRNYLRAEVMPLLETRWPGYRKTVTRAADHMAEVAGWLRETEVTPQTQFSVLGDPGLALQSLLGEDEAESARLLRAWLKGGGYLAPGKIPLQEFLRQLRQLGKGAEDAAPRLDCGNYCLQRFQDGVYILPPEHEVDDELPALAPGESLDLSGIGEIGLERAADQGLWLALDEHPELRLRAGGERCRPVSRRRSASLKKILQEEGVPPWWRNRVPLLVLDEVILAIGALGPCDSERWGAEGEEEEASWQLYWKPAVAPGFD